jgi:hypothetical protein
VEVPCRPRGRGAKYCDTYLGYRRLRSRGDSVWPNAWRRRVGDTLPWGALPNVWSSLVLEGTEDSKARLGQTPLLAKRVPDVQVLWGPKMTPTFSSRGTP